MLVCHLAVVLPAFNEAEGLPGFLTEIETALRGRVERLSFLVVNDASTDDTVGQLARMRVRDDLAVLTNPVNRGHGPSALAAYRGGLATGADAVLHVDGDGQFVGKDLARVLDGLNGHDGVVGVRRGRHDPWFRRALTGMLFVAAWRLTRARLPDVNSPLRLYRAGTLRTLLALVPENSMVPHIRFSLLENRERLCIARVSVQSIPRRSSVATGTMWGSGSRAPFLLPPRRLTRFVVKAGWELWNDRPTRRQRCGTTPATTASTPTQLPSAPCAPTRPGTAPPELT